MKMMMGVSGRRVLVNDNAVLGLRMNRRVQGVC
jgi:hypothetical protein